MQPDPKPRPYRGLIFDLDGVLEFIRTARLRIEKPAITTSSTRAELADAKADFTVDTSAELAGILSF